jgi:hypothetical protein
VINNVPSRLACDRTHAHARRIEPLVKEDNTNYDFLNKAKYLSF